MVARKHENRWRRLGLAAGATAAQVRAAMVGHILEKRLEERLEERELVGRYQQDRE